MNTTNWILDSRPAVLSSSMTWWDIQQNRDKWQVVVGGSNLYLDQGILSL